MPDDPQAIRNLVAEWHRATSAGDAEGLRPLIDEDVVFLLPGQPPLRGRDAFISGMHTGFDQVHIESSSNIQEIQVAGDLAYLWNQLTVTITPRKGGPPKRKSGYTLTVLRRQPGGSWGVWRDANLLTDEAG